MTENPIRILFVVPSYSGGGAERVALTLLAGLDARHFSATLLVFDDIGPLKNMVPDGITTITLGVSRLRDALVPLVRSIRRIRPDIIFSTLGYVNLALLASRFVLPRKTRIVVREANMPSLSLPNSTLPTFSKIAYRVLYPWADTVVCTSNQMVEEMHRDFGVSLHRLWMLPNPVDEKTIRDAATPTSRKRGDGLRLVAAGRLTRQKGFDRLIGMMGELDLSTRLTILGTGPEETALRSMVEHMGISERVCFAGFCDNPWSLYAGADVFVMPSRWEGMPNALLEALACGTKVIATPQSGGVADIKSASESGAIDVVEVGNPFRDVLLALLPDLGANGLPRASLLPEQYKLANVIAAFQDMLRGNSQTQNPDIPI